MSLPLTDLVRSLPASTPFVGPETLERKRGKTFKARIGANESAFGISPLARDAITEAVQTQGACWYADPENFTLRTALAEKHQVHIDEICVDGGIDSLLGLSVRMLVSPGSAVITSAGAYPTFNYHVAGFGGRLITVPYRDNHEDPDALLAKAIEQRANLIYLSNPDNPMGTYHQATRISDMIKDVPAHAVLMLDEAYIDFTTLDLAPPINTQNKRVMRFRTFSKAYGMAGMRVGYVIAHKEIITNLNKIRNHFAINRLSQIAATAALEDHAFLASVRERAALGRQKIYDLADRLKLPYLNSATNFVAVDLSTPERAQSLLAELADHDVFMRMPGAAPLNTHIRIGIGTEAEHAWFAEKFEGLLPR